MGKRLTTETFIERAKELFDNYDYSKVNYVNAPTLVELKCMQHDFEFSQRPRDLLKGNKGCKYCSHRGLSNEDFIEMSKEVFGDGVFDYSKTAFTKTNGKVVVVCAKHGSEWNQNVQGHLKGLNPCQDCNGQRPIDREEFIRRSKLKFGNDRLGYEKVSEIKGIHTKVILTCKKHNKDYIQEAWSNLNGMMGCPDCSGTIKLTKEKIMEKAFLATGKELDYSQVDWAKSVRDKQVIGCDIEGHGFFTQTFDGLFTGKIGCRICDKSNRLTTLDEFIERSIQKHGPDRYGYDKAILTNGLYGNIQLKCLKHDEYFTYSIFRILQGLEGCKKCRHAGSSKKEKQLAEFVNSLGFEIIVNDRKLLKPKEIDIYIPELKIAIEFNGVYWHSDKRVDKNYHYDKWKACHDKGVRLLTIWEDDWDNKPDIVKSHIKHVLGVSESERIYARKTQVVVLTKSDALSFLQDNHIQGFVNSSIYLGLKSGETLVAVASFVRSLNNYTLTRYATSKHVIGGHSKLVKYFENNYSFEKLVTFADLMFSDGSLYERTGWLNDGFVRPDYSYVFGGERYHKFGFRKKRFESDPLLMFVDGLSERELADLNDLERVYDSGKIRFVREHKDENV